MIDASFAYLREFAPHVIAAVEFEASVEAKPLLAAVEVLRELYARGGRKVPEDAPAEFVPTRWRGYLTQAAKAGDTTAYRHYWELCTLLGLRDALRSGDVWVPGSRRYADPTTFLLPAERWAGLRGEYCVLVDVPSSADIEVLLATGEGPVRLSEQGQLHIGRLSAEARPGSGRAAALRAGGAAAPATADRVAHRGRSVVVVVGPAHPRRRQDPPRGIVAPQLVRGDPCAGLQLRVDRDGRGLRHLL